MEKNTTFMRQTGADSPAPRKQSTGLFVSRCGESGLFESRHSVKNKKLFHQTVKELFVVRVVIQNFSKTIVVQFVFEVIG